MTDIVREGREIMNGQEKRLKWTVQLKYVRSNDIIRDKKVLAVSYSTESFNTVKVTMTQKAFAARDISGSVEWLWWSSNGSYRESYSVIEGIR